jgi:hypothetical protein
MKTLNIGETPGEDNTERQARIKCKLVEITKEHPINRFKDGGMIRSSHITQ